jgi:sugar O-acyltransferase (sialic acid O-acetyltransferase NeuD family)
LNILKKKIVILGNGSLAKTLGYFVTQDGQYELMGFAIEKKYIKEKKIHDKKIFTFRQLNKLKINNNFEIINGIGYQQNCLIRKKIQEKLSKEFKFHKYIHSKSYVSKFCKISPGAIIMPNASLETNSIIGKGAVIWSNVVVGHGSKIGDFCWLSAGCVVGGDSIVKKNSFVGINASITNKITIGENNIIGINTSIQKNTSKNSVFITKQGERLNIKSDLYSKLFLK